MTNGGFGPLGTESCQNAYKIRGKPGLPLSGVSCALMRFWTTGDRKLDGGHESELLGSVPIPIIWIQWILGDPDSAKLSKPCVLLWKSCVPAKWRNKIPRNALKPWFSRPGFGHLSTSWFNEKLAKWRTGEMLLDRLISVHVVKSLHVHGYPRHLLRRLFGKDFTGRITA